MLANGPEFWDLGHFPKELQLRQIPLKYPRLSGGIGPHPQVGLGHACCPQKLGIIHMGQWRALEMRWDNMVDKVGGGSSRGQKGRGCKLHCAPDAQSSSSLEGWLVSRQGHYHWMAHL